MKFNATVILIYHTNIGKGVERMTCPNKCGELVQIKNAATIIPTEDVMPLIQTELEKGKIEAVTKIDAIYPKCGFVCVRETRSFV